MEKIYQFIKGTILFPIRQFSYTSEQSLLGQATSVSSWLLLGFLTIAFFLNDAGKVANPDIIYTKLPALIVTLTLAVIFQAVGLEELKRNKENDPVFFSTCLSSSVLVALIALIFFSIF